MPNNRWRRVRRLKRIEIYRILDNLPRLMKEVDDNSNRYLSDVTKKITAEDVKELMNIVDAQPGEPEAEVFVPLMSTHSNPPKKKWYQRIADQVREAFHHDG